MFANYIIVSKKRGGPESAFHPVGIERPGGTRPMADIREVIAA